MLNKPVTVKHLLIGFSALFLIFQVQTCSTKNAITTQAKKSKEAVAEFVKGNDSLLQNHSDVILLKVEQEGYKISSRLLYDQNYIVRNPNVRPDDKMAEYQKEAEKLQKQIESKLRSKK